MTTTDMRSRTTRIADTVLLTVALLLAATSAYILIDPVSPSDFESTTGADWATFSGANPEVADYLSREARLLAVGWLGLNLLVAATVWWALRRGDLWAGRSLWLFPITLIGAGLIFLGGDGPALAGMYVVAGVVSGAALAAGSRRGRGV